MSPSIPIADQLKSLECLQELDLKIQNLSKKKDSRPQSLIDLEESISVLQKKWDAKKIDFDGFQKSLGQTNAALELNAERMQRAKGKMDGVNNSHEFSAANKEIEQLKKLNATLDEQKAVSVKDAESVQKELDEIEGKKKELQDKLDRESGDFNSEVSNLDGDLAKLNGERKPYLDGIEKQIVSRYERIRKARGGIGIAPAANGRCQGCNMVLTHQNFIHVLKAEEICYCPSCNRLLFPPRESPSIAEED